MWTSFMLNKINVMVIALQTLQAKFWLIYRNYPVYLSVTLSVHLSVEQHMNQYRLLASLVV